MPVVSVSARVRAKLAMVEPLLSAESLRILRHPRPGELYPEYMRRMHGISRAAVPLMEAALARAPLLDDDDPTAEPLCEYLRSHIPEERGHADWVLEDLEVIGFQPSFVTDHAPSPTVASLVGAQYYWIEHVHPVALMGYLAVMEANPPPIEEVDRLAAVSGFPPGAFRSMRLHAHLDVAHREDLYRAMDGLALTAWHEQLVGMSALHTAELLAYVLTELADEFDS